MESQRLSSSPELRPSSPHMMHAFDLEAEDRLPPSSALDRQESQDLMAPERYTILSPAERDQGLARARETISPSGISGFFKSALNTVIGWFSSERAQLNSAKALLAKPTAQLTAAVNFMTRFNAKIEGVGVDEDFAPMTFENFSQYIEALQNGQLLIADEASETGYRAVTPSQICEDRQDSFEMRFFMLELEKDLTRLGPQMINVGNDLGKYLALTPDQVLGEVEKTVNAWRVAILTVGETVSDAEFRGIVTAATQTLGATVSRPEFVEAQAVSDWARLGQQNFVDEAAQEFARAVKTLKEQAPAEQPDQNMEALQTLLASIDTRARELGRILGEEDVEGIRDQLLDKLNQHEGFKAALETVQEELREVVRTNQSVEDLTQETMDAMLAGQTGIIEAEKTLEGTPLKGEAAVAESFRGLLDPENTIALLMAGGMSEEAARQKVAVDFPEHAQKAVDTFARAEQALAATLYNNDRVIAEGQERANVALGKLALLNQFISEDNKAEMEVDPELENDPIELPESKEERQAFIATELREAFLERFEALAGNTDAEAHATLLEQLIVQLGPDGTSAVLGAPVDPRDIFAEVRTGSGQPVAFGGKTLLTFAASEDGPRGIDQLRTRIRANRAVLDHQKQRQREVQEALFRSTEPVATSTGIMARIAGLFSRRAPQEGSRETSSPALVDRVETSSPLLASRSLSELDLEEEEFVPEQQGRLAKIGSAIATPFRWIAGLFGRKEERRVDLMSSTHEYHRLPSSPHSSQTSFGSFVGTPRPGFNTGDGLNLDEEDSF